MKNICLAENSQNRLVQNPKQIRAMKIGLTHVKIENVSKKPKIIMVNSRNVAQELKFFDQFHFFFEQFQSF